MAFGRTCRTVAFGLAATALSVVPAFALAADKPLVLSFAEAYELADELLAEPAK